MTYDTAFFYFNLFKKDILFYIKETDSSIFLEFQKLPRSDSSDIDSDKDSDSRDSAEVSIFTWG